MKKYYNRFCLLFFHFFIFSFFVSHPVFAQYTPASSGYHQAGGGGIVESDITLSNNTTLNVGTSTHGLVPKADGTPSHFLNGQTGAWVNAVYILSQSAVKHSLTGTTTSTLLASYTIPANTLLPNSSIRIETQWSATPNNANQKDGIVKIGSTTLSDSTNLTSNLSDMGLIILSNSNGTGSQTAMASGSNIYNHSSLGPAYYTFDFTQNQTVYFYGTLAVATDTMSLEKYILVHYPSP